MKVSECEKSDYNAPSLKQHVILFVDSDDTMPDKIVFSSPALNARKKKKNQADNFLSFHK